MDKQFKPYRRSQIWLGEPAVADAYNDEGTKIAERLRSLNSQELFDIAADEQADDRARWQATLKLTRDEAQRLANMLIQRSEDFWWASMVRLCPPTNSPNTIEALRQRLQSPERRCRHRAMQLLSELGDRSFAADVHAMLDSNDRIERLVAISCLAVSDFEESKQILRNYAACKSKPLRSRVDAATRLLRMGEKQYSKLLVRIAREELCESAYYAACGILHHHDRTEAFKLFLEILSKPDHAATPVSVMHITTLMGNHRLGFELDGLAHSRRWLESEIENAR